MLNARGFVHPLHVKSVCNETELTKEKVLFSLEFKAFDHGLEKFIYTWQRWSMIWSKMRAVILLLLMSVSLTLVGCVKIPRGIQPVQGFELEKYLGKWYEVARLDHRFERGLSQVSAEYSLRDDGGVDVINRGYKSATGEWKEAKGKAYFVSKTDQGHLKVSFFGPFYGSYVIFELDDYQHAYICGPDKSYLWFLSRTPKVTSSQREAFLEKAKSLGFDAEQIIFVEHE